MRPEMRLEVMRRLVAMVEDPSQEVPKRTTRIDVARYTDPAELEREHAALFRRQPLIVAHASELPDPGDFVTQEVAGVPLIVLRDEQGEVGVFVNACRHRGARLLEEESGRCKKALVCPYHAWSYRLDGSLLNATKPEVFDALDTDSLGLRPVSHAVRHGFVWVQLDGDPDAQLDIAATLGPMLDEDFAGFEFAKHQAMRSVSVVRRCNWKLVMDAFAEGYHLKYLHRQSLARFFMEGQILDDCAPHVRQVGARKSLLEAARGPEAGWDLRRDTTVFYNVFPNAVIVFHPIWISQMSLFPVGVDRVRVVHRMLAPTGARSEEEQAKLEKSFDHIHQQVFEKEDLAISESVQSTLSSGANDHVLLGGLEEGMRLFHQARDRALAGAEG